jgi:hypothetical protein
MENKVLNCISVYSEHPEFLEALDAHKEGNYYARRGEHPNVPFINFNTALNFEVVNSLKENALELCLAALIKEAKMGVVTNIPGDIYEPDFDTSERFLKTVREVPENFDSNLYYINGFIDEELFDELQEDNPEDYKIISEGYLCKIPLNVDADTLKISVPVQGEPDSDYVDLFNALPYTIHIDVEKIKKEFPDREFVYIELFLIGDLYDYGYYY